jgi:hypothetical protein
MKSIINAPPQTAGNIMVIARETATGDPLFEIFVNKSSRDVTPT